MRKIKEQKLKNINSLFSTFHKR